MSDWIDLSALWRIVVLGLLFGAGLPGLFGIGLRAAVAPAARPAALLGAGLCFAAVLAAVGAGIYLVVAGS